jgi:hypothetical protein
MPNIKPFDDLFEDLTRGAKRPKRDKKDADVCRVYLALIIAESLDEPLERGIAHHAHLHHAPLQPPLVAFIFILIGQHTLNVKIYYRLLEYVKFYEGICSNSIEIL